MNESRPDLIPTEAAGGAAAARPSLTKILTLSTVLLIISALWVRKTSLVGFSILVAEGAPPIPALAALVGLTAVGFMVHRLTQTSKLKNEALMVYVTMSLCLVTLEANGVRQLLASLTVPRYFAAPGNDFAAFAEYVPAWMTPNSDLVIRDFYEGSANGMVPWGAWAGPLLAWGALFMLVGLTLVCLISLFRRPWSEEERLTYPLAELVLQLSPDPVEKGHTHLLRNPLFWVGVAVAAIYNISNIAHAFSPSTPAIGQSYDFSKLLTERPWTALRPLNLAFRPEIIGLGYLVPVDVLLSVWSFFLLFRFENLGAEMGGYSISNFPFEAAQGMGAYVGLMIFLIWVARKHLREIAINAFGGPKPSWDAKELMPSRFAFWGVIIGIVGMITFCLMAGIELRLALPYVLLSLGAALVYIRVRAQTGLPVNYILPREQVFESILALKPTTGHFSAMELRSETVFTTVTIMSRMTFPQLGAFSMEGIRIGDRARISRKLILTCIAYGLLAGFVIGMFMHLQAYYSYGANVLDGGTTEGGYRIRGAVGAFDRLQQRASQQVPMDVRTTTARVIGLVLTLAMLWLRMRFLRFPLNPLGLAVAGSYGHSIWFAVFMAWLSKTLIMRLGGAHTYRLATPLFLGIAVGHVLMAGGIWGIVGAFSEDVAKRYLIWFA
jgi:hypothetical protein